MGTRYRLRRIAALTVCVTGVAACVTVAGWCRGPGPPRYAGRVLRVSQWQDSPQYLVEEADGSLIRVWILSGVKVRREDGGAPGAAAGEWVRVWADSGVLTSYPPITVPRLVVVGGGP